MIGKHVKKVCSIIICVSMLASMAACQKSPDSSLVVNKDFDKLIEEAEGTDTGKVKIEDIADVEYDDYVTSFEDSDLGVKVNVNAKVDIPKTDHLSIFRVKQAPFTQEFIDKVRSELMGDVPIYDGYALNIETKSDIEESIAYWRTQIDNTDNEAARADYQARIDELQKKYDSAPVNINLTEYPSDGKLRTTKEIYNEKAYYEWAYDMYPDGDVLSVVTNGTDGNYARLDVHNSAEKSNQLAYSVNKTGHRLRNGYAGAFLDTDTIRSDEYTIEKPENYIGADVLSSTGEPIKYYKLKGDSCELELEEAVVQANELLQNLGLTEFGYYDGKKATDSFTSTKDGGGIIYRTFYALTYYRNIDGVFLTQSSGTKNNMSEGNDAMLYGKISWPGEIITIQINDDGIVGFRYSSPVEITETVVENASIKSFEDVRETFEKMMVVTKAGKDTTAVYDIDRVRLSYSRISEANSYDTGLIVPVWDFYGYYQRAWEGIIINEGNTTALAINAIDGSIIDPDLGY